MTTILNASSSSGLVATADTSAILQLQTGSTAAVTIDASQNVGIGTASPSFKVQITAPVVNAGVSVGQLITNAGTGNAGSAIGLGYNTGNGYYAQVAGVYDGTGSAFTVSTSALGVAAAERMRITSAGNVGIGNSATSPSNLLTLRDTGDITFAISKAGVGGFDITNAGTSGTTLGTQDPYILAFKTNNTERMRITSAGNVGIGTAGAFKLDVYSGSSGVVANLQSVDAYNAETGLTFSSQRAKISGFLNGGGATPGTSLRFYTMPDSGSVTERMRINSDGAALFSLANFTNGVSSTNAGFAIENNGNSPFINHAQGGTGLTTYYVFINANGTVGTIRTTGSSTQFNTSSDGRLKENVVDAPSAIDSINQIGIKSFDWKADGLHQDYGVIAQDLQQIAPEAVSEAPTEDESWGVDYSKLVPRMIKAMQEQQALITDLTTRLAALEGAK
jgi:hypothetical protein